MISKKGCNLKLKKILNTANGKAFNKQGTRRFASLGSAKRRFERANKASLALNIVHKRNVASFECLRTKEETSHGLGQIRANEPREFEKNQREIGKKFFYFKSRFF